MYIITLKTGQRYEVDTYSINDKFVSFKRKFTIDQVKDIKARIDSKPKILL